MHGTPRTLSFQLANPRDFHRIYGLDQIQAFPCHNEMIIGQLEKFDVSLFLEIIETYLQADEVERALWVIDNLPSRYRVNPPKAILDMKKAILAAMITPHGYLTSPLDMGGIATLTDDLCEKFIHENLRGILLYKEVKRYNEKGRKPHLIDVGPGEYFVPVGLKKMGCEFSYFPVSADQRAKEMAYPLFKDLVQEKPQEGQPIIFAALEIIEHLAYPQDLVIEAAKYSYGFPIERVHLSTPMFCYNGKQKDWKKPFGLPHLRTYAPFEFINIGQKLFPEYHIELFASFIMSLRCSVNGTEDSEPLVVSDP
jgi:hypothetical protein